MPTAAISNRWRWTSLVLGVLLPAWIWGMATNYFWRPLATEELRGGSWLLLSAWVIAVVEIACLAWWLIPVQRGARAEKNFSLVFAIGAVGAGVWLLSALMRLIAPMGFDVSQSYEVGTVLLWLGTPFACIWVYGVSARRARDRARAIWDAG